MKPLTQRVWASVWSIVVCGAWLAAAGVARGEGAGPCVASNARPYDAKGKLRLVIGTGNSGGVFFPYGGGIARIISDQLPNTEMTAEVTGGSVDNLKLLAKKKTDLALSTVDSAYDAASGGGAYQDVGKVPVCALAVLYESFVHIVALEGSGIKDVAGMKGKRISLGSPGSSTEVLAMRVLAAAGLDGKKDLSPQYLSVSEATSAMKDGKIDAFFWIGGMPTAAVTDLITTPNIKVKFLDGGKSVDQLKEKNGSVYVPLTLRSEEHTSELQSH